MNSKVEITQSGRGGSIYYREGGNEIAFDWEFAGGSAVALLLGTKAEHWDARYPWAAGRQAEIYESVVRETIRQKASNSRYTIDLQSGDITIY